MQDDNNWYSNRDLYEMLNPMRSEINAVMQELKQTQEIIKRYNDLHNRVLTLEEREVTRDVTLKKVRDWSGWFLAGALGLIKLFQWLSSYPIPE